MALPGWGSPASVVQIHAALEGAALLFFAALVVFDILAHLNKGREVILERIGLICFGIAVLAEIVAFPYSRRNDALSAQATHDADKRIAELNKEAQDAQKETEQLRKDAEGLKKQAEDERSARTKLEGEIQPRTLSKTQIADLRRLLHPLAGTNVDLMSYPGDAEAVRLGLQLGSIFTEERLNVQGGLGRALGSADAVTIGVQIYAPASESDRRQTLFSALHDGAGLEMARTQPTSGPGTPIVVLIGVKPLPQSAK